MLNIECSPADCAKTHTPPDFSFFFLDLNSTAELGRERGSGCPEQPTLAVAVLSCVVRGFSDNAYCPLGEGLMSDLSVRTAPKSSRGQSSRQAAKPRKRKAWGTVRKPGKIRQAEKINELRKALLGLGYELGAASTAQSLGLGRSTLWAIFNSKHRYSGLSSKTIRRML